MNNKTPSLFRTVYTVGMELVPLQRDLNYLLNNKFQFARHFFSVCAEFLAHNSSQRGRDGQLHNFFLFFEFVCNLNFLS